MKTKHITRLGAGVVIHRTNEELVAVILKRKRMMADLGENVRVAA